VADERGGNAQEKARLHGISAVTRRDGQHDANMVNDF